MIVIYSWTATVILNGMAEPFALAKNLFIEQTNELIIMILIYHMLCFADLVTEEQTRNNIGWSMIAIMCGTIVFNFSIILFDSIGVFYKKVRLWYYSRKNLIRWDKLMEFKLIWSSKLISSQSNYISLQSLLLSLELEPPEVWSQTLTIALLLMVVHSVFVLSESTDSWSTDEWQLTNANPWLYISRITLNVKEN